MGMSSKMIKTIKEVIPVIYAYTTPEIARHDGYIKIGDTGRETGKRLDEQMLTSDVHYNLEWELNAIYEGTNETFRDKDFHAYMQKQGKMPILTSLIYSPLSFVRKKELTLLNMKRF